MRFLMLSMVFLIFTRIVFYLFSIMFAKTYSIIFCNFRTVLYGHRCYYTCSNFRIFREVDRYGLARLFTALAIPRP